MGDEGSVATLIAKVLSDYGALDIVVSTVGGFAAGQAVTDLALRVLTEPPASRR